jgi:hypothetical protein
MILDTVGSMIRVHLRRSFTILNLLAAGRFQKLPLLQLRKRLL